MTDTKLHHHSLWPSISTTATTTDHHDHDHDHETRTTRGASSSQPHASMQETMTDLSPQTPLLSAGCESSSTSGPLPLVDDDEQPQRAGQRPLSFESRRTALTSIPEGYATARRERRAAAAAQNTSPSLRDTLLRKRLRLFRMLKSGLEMFIGVWAVFNIIRYLISYPRYNSGDGQFVSLALALSASFSLAFLGCAVLLSIFRTSLVRRIPPRASHVIRKTLRIAASVLLLAPAVTNVVFLSLWKDEEGNQEFGLRTRCRVDIDLVWSISQSSCPTSPWVVWLGLGLVRLVVTLVVLTSYHVVCRSYGRTLRLSSSHRLSVLGPYEHPAGSLSIPTTPKSPGTPIKETSTFLDPRHSKHRPSRSTLCSTNVEATVSVLPYHPTSAGSATMARPTTHSSTSTSSSDEYSLPPGLQQEAYSTNQNWADVRGENFRTLISQINQEIDDVRLSRLTDEDAELDEEDERGDPHSQYTQYTQYMQSNAHSESPYSYNLPPLPPTIGYNEFGQPYPPEEPHPILNGYIRRMPTIESMGSRELGSIASSSVLTGLSGLTGFTGNVMDGRHEGGRAPGSARSTMTFETRPISRADLVVTPSGSERSEQGRSRPNSFGARAELMVSLGTSEVGELRGREEVGERRNEEKADHGAGGTTSTNASTTTSRSTTLSSYHTATSGSVYTS